MGVSQQVYWSGLPFPPPVDHVLSELSTMTCPSWVTLHWVVHSFTELPKPLHHGKTVIHEGRRIRIWELDHKEGSRLKNWCFQTVVLEKTLENHLDSKEIKPVSLKGNQPWILTGKTDAKAEVPIFWPPDVNHQLIGKDPDTGKDWGQEKKGTTEDEMVGWHHQFSGHEDGGTLGGGRGQGSLVCCGLWGCKESDMTWWLNNNNKNNPSPFEIKLRFKGIMWCVQVHTERFGIKQKSNSGAQILAEDSRKS